MQALAAMEQELQAPAEVQHGRQGHSIAEDHQPGRRGARRPAESRGGHGGPQGRVEGDTGRHRCPAGLYLLRAVGLSRAVAVRV